MATEQFLKFSRFDIYCKTCEHCDKPEWESPCNECLDIGARAETRKPEYYKEARKEHKRG